MKQKGFVLLPVVLIIILLVIVGYFLYQNRQKTSEATSPSPSTELKESTPNPNSPKENTLYLGEYNGKEVIYYSNPSFNKGDTFNGAVRCVGISCTISYPDPSTIIFQYSNLSNAKIIASGFPTQDFSVVSVEHKNATTLYVSMVFIPYVSTNGSRAPYNVIYEINMSNVSKREIWRREITNGLYKEGDTEFGGAVSITQVVGNHMGLSIGLCFDCSPYSQKHGVMVLNASSGKELFLGMVTDVKINTKDNIVTYRKLDAFVEPCPPETFFCEDQIGDGKRNVFKPAGDILSKALP